MMFSHDTRNLITAVGHLLRLVDVAYLLKNEPYDDHVKRALMRLLFVEIDSLLNVTPRLKNAALAELPGNRAGQRKSVEDAISILRKSYDGSFDAFRDKISAHAQPLSEIGLLNLWGSIDYSVIEVFRSDIGSMQAALEDLLGEKFTPVPDYRPLPVVIGGPLASNDDVMHQMYPDRLGATKGGSHMISMHSSMSKGQLVLSIVDFLSVDFALTLLVDDPKTIFTRLVFEAGWILAVIDLCSLLDNLFTDTTHDKSLLSEWAAVSMHGLASLQQLESSRDLPLEAEVRRLRNKYCAHLDVDQSVQSIAGDFATLDLQVVHRYCVRLVNGFELACREDMRTKLLTTKPVALPGIRIATPGTVRPFNDTT